MDTFRPLETFIMTRELADRVCPDKLYLVGERLQYTPGKMTAFANDVYYNGKLILRLVDISRTEKA